GGVYQKRGIWAKALDSRQQKALPYVFFTDTVNRHTRHVYEDQEHNILTSNRSSQIALPSSQEDSLICCLSAMNLELDDEWQDTEAAKLAIYFLDAVLQEFIAKTEDNYFLSSANRFASRHRALGLGVLGWHSYLQKNRMPFEGLQAKGLTHSIFKDINEKALKASKSLADI